MHLIVDNVKQERMSTGHYPTPGVRYVQFSKGACELINCDDTCSQRCVSLLIIFGPEIRQDADVSVCALHGKVNITQNCSTQLNLKSTGGLQCIRLKVGYEHL